MNNFLYILCFFFFIEPLFASNVMQKSTTPQHSLTIISSPSCPACEKFYKDKFPEIQDFAKANNIAIHYFAFAADKRTVTAVALTYALSSERQHELYLGFLNSHEKWHVEGEKGLLALKTIAESMGIPDATVERILYDEDEPLKEQVFQSILEMSQRHKITFVPAILIDNQHLVEADIDELKKKLKELEKMTLIPVAPSA